MAAWDGMTLEEFREEFGLESVSTSSERVSQWLCQQTGLLVVFCTYHSQRVLVEAANMSDRVLDLAIYDEADHTAGKSPSPCNVSLTDHSLRVRLRVFLIAIPKIFKSNAVPAKNIFSMDSDDFDSPVRYNLPMSVAMQQGVLPPVRVHIMSVDGCKVPTSRRTEKALVAVLLHADIAKAVHLRRCMETLGLRKVLVVCNLNRTAALLVEKVLPFVWASVDQQVSSDFAH